MMNLTNLMVSDLWIAQFYFLNCAERFHGIPQVDFYFLPWPPGFPAPPQYSNPLSFCCFRHLAGPVIHITLIEEITSWVVY